MVLSWEDVLEKVNKSYPDDYSRDIKWMDAREMNCERAVKIGDRVEILNCLVYKNKYIGEHGTVEYIGDDCRSRGGIGVRIDSRYNCNSQQGLFWYHEYELKVMNKPKEENEMANANALKGDYKIALVDIEGSYCKGYSFALYPTEQNVVVGDYVLVDNAGGKSVGKVANIVDKGQATMPTKEVICKLDFSNFEARKKARKERKEAMAEMKKLADESQTLALYKMLAETDPRMKELLSKVEGLEDC